MGSEEIAKQAATPAHQRTPDDPYARLKRLLSGTAYIAVFIALSYHSHFHVALALSATGAAFYAACAASAGFVLCFVYITVYLPRVKGIVVDLDKWETEIPKTIQLATACIVSSSICWNVALWHQLSFMAPVVLLSFSLALIGVFKLF